MNIYDFAGESLFAYCSPYKRALDTWEIIEDYLECENEDILQISNKIHMKKGVKVIGFREEPRIAEQQFGNFQNPHKVRTAKSERRTFGRFFFRFPNGESGLDVYSRCSSFLATLSRDIKQIDQRYSSFNRCERNDVDEDAMENMNILIVCHGLTLRLLLMRYFMLTVEEFENSYNSQNAKLVVMDRFVYDDDDAHADPGNRKYYCEVSETYQLGEYYKLNDTAKETLNLLGDISNKKPVYKRSLTKSDSGILLVDGDDDNLVE